LSALFDSAVFPSVLASVFLAGLIASPHCTVMCGPLVAALSPTRAHILWHQLGRGISYALAGAMAAHVFAQTQFRIPEKFSFLAMIGLVLVLIYFLFRSQSMQTARINVNSGSRIFLAKLRLFQKIRRLAQSHSHLASFLGGLVTPLLPCGQLYLVLSAAALTGHWLFGSLVMMSFWASTVPAVVMAPLIWQRFFQRMDTSSNRARLASGLIFVAGMLSLALFTQNLSSKFDTGHRGQATSEGQAAKQLRCH